ncbi:YdcF family protein [Bacillus suaedae]|uniref:YdcF family protein n=1 Tax=Halalkalibacter suaedae TaxID=2822140 RepID=A0A940X098_9BACI|nr:YdcF family protein [Bacillus suaedae]MBP3951744.1 YdcF family protein [Bacillus suaedae]
MTKYFKGLIEVAKRTVLKLCFGILVLFIVFTIYLAYSIWSFAEENQLVETDVAVVLGAAAWGDEPSPVLRERINHSIWLYENGYVEKIIFTGGKGVDDEFAESEVARDYAIKNNVNSDDILIETKSKITEENLTYANDIITENDFKTVTIVSDPLHMKRAILMAENTGIVAYSSPTQTSVYQTWKSEIPFLFRELFFYSGYIVSLPFR